MDNSETLTLATFGTQDTGRRQTNKKTKKHNTTQKIKKNMNPGDRQV